MTVRLVGMPSLNKRFDAMLKRAEERIVDVRKKVARELMDALMSNVPVWSGRAVRSLSAANAPSSNAPVEVHPDRGNTSKDGRWNSHPEFGDTKNQALGAESQRRSAEGTALASLGAVSYDINSKLFITSSSYMWDIIDNATYRGSESRNNAVVSALAIAQIRARFGNVLK